jgi:hypothetical protein
MRTPLEGLTLMMEAGRSAVLSRLDLARKQGWGVRRLPGVEAVVGAVELDLGRTLGDVPQLKTIVQSAAEAAGAGVKGSHGFSSIYSTRVDGTSSNSQNDLSAGGG